MKILGSVLSIVSLIVYGFAAEYELRCMRNALDMGDNEEIVDIAKRFYRVRLHVFELHCSSYRNCGNLNL